MKMDVQQQAPERVTSGIPGFDDVVGGGLVRGHTYLVVGSAGTGKTLLSLQWLREGIAHGEKALYVTLAETSQEIRANARTLGWNLEGIEFIDLAPSGVSLADQADEYRVFAPSEVEKDPMWRAICQQVVERSPRRVVLDSLTQLRYLSTDEYQFRKHILALVNFLNSRGCTSLLTFEPDELQRETSVALAVNGVIRLRTGISPGLAIGLRSVQVEKMRGSGFMSGRHPLRITPRGLEVFPHVVQEIGDSAVGERCYPTGIASLDELLCGGIESGTTTLLSGPAGGGKTTLGTHFLVQQAAHSRAVLFTFEEPVGLVARRARDTGAPIDAALASGALRIERVNPLDRYPDEFLAHVRRAVEEEGRRFVMVDGLRGYQMAMEEFGSPQAHIHNLVAYLTGAGVTTLLVSEVEHITSANLVATDMGVSHLADNILLLRYAEDAGRVTKVIGCLKKRAGNFEPELREMRITGTGIEVGGKLNRLRGILTGVPTMASP
jgi:circadian clock protein KaiC